MAKLTKQDTAALRRIVKDATGRDLSVGESYAALHYLLRLLHLVCRTEVKSKFAPASDQLGLFDI